jgi:glycosyltransferase involved in cell wall biosynthesis
MPGIGMSGKASDKGGAVLITTFNRRQVVEFCAAALAEVESHGRWDVWVLDDASTDYRLDELKRLFPGARRVMRNDANLGAGPNAAALARQALSGNYDRFLFLDSDLVISPQAFGFIDEVLDQTEGVLSIYNSCLHASTKPTENGLCVKSSVGTAGTVWQKPLLEEVLARVPTDRHWDWRFCRYLGSTGRQIAVSTRSYAQHIGLGGLNTKKFGDIDFGLNFTAETNTHLAALAWQCDALLSAQRRYRARPAWYRHYRRFRGRLRFYLSAPGSQD